MNNDYAVNTECRCVTHSSDPRVIPSGRAYATPPQRFPGSSRPRASPSRSAQTMSRLAASLRVVLVLAALATVLGEEVLLDGLHRRRVALLVGSSSRTILLG